MDAEGSLKNDFTFYTPTHLFRLRYESSESAAADTFVFAPPPERDDTFVPKNRIVPLAEKNLNT